MTPNAWSGISGLSGTNLQIQSASGNPALLIVNGINNQAEIHLVDVAVVIVVGLEAVGGATVRDLRAGTASLERVEVVAVDVSIAIEVAGDMIRLFRGFIILLMAGITFGGSVDVLVRFLTRVAGLAVDGVDGGVVEGRRTPGSGGVAG